jgi:hypothetical protein
MIVACFEKKMERGVLIIAKNNYDILPFFSNKLQTTYFTVY